MSNLKLHVLVYTYVLTERVVTLIIPQETDHLAVPLIGNRYYFFYVNNWI